MSAVTWPAIPTDDALSSALASDFPRGVKLAQATPERAGHVTLRIETAPGATSATSATVEGLLFSASAAAEFAAAKADYAAMGARVATLGGAMPLLLPLGGADRELRSLGELLSAGSPWRLVRHRLERRAVLRNEAAGVHGKLFKSRKKALRAAERLELVRAAALPAPEVRAVDRVRPLVSIETVPGASLLEILGRADAVAACRAAGTALSRVATAPLDPALLERHGVEEELAVIERWLAPLETLAPAVHGEASRVFHRLREAARGLEPGTPAPSHRDFYDKQIIVAEGGERVRVVDWDSLALADPALDAGNFLAHLHLRVRQGAAPAAREAALRRAFLDGRLETGGSTESRIPFFESAALLRIAALYALRPPHARLVPGLLAAAAERGERP